MVVIRVAHAVLTPQLMPFGFVRVSITQNGVETAPVVVRCRGVGDVRLFPRELCSLLGACQIS